MLSEHAFRRIVRASAVYDLVITAPFATPWTCAAVLKLLANIDDRLGLAGTAPDVSPSSLLFANLMGSVVIVWSVARAMWPEPRLGRLDAVARGLFATWMVYAATHGVSSILGGFLVIELSWMVLQLLPFRSAALPAHADAAR